MKKILFVLTVLIASLFTSSVFALSEKDITFPVSELGGCKDEAECRTFCDKPENKMSPCFPFAKKYNLLTQEELDKAERFTQLAVTGGPGWCRSGEGCSVEVFCNDFAHLDQCVDFAADNNFATEEQLADARKMVAGMKKGANPPGNCRGDNECNIYCALEGNWQECLKWSDDIGIPFRLSPEGKKFVDLIKSGKSAGGCQSKTACETYCSDPGHSQECLDMAVAAGFITAEEAELAKKYGGTGPGGCKSESDCQAFCSQPYNQRVCLNYANDQGIKVDFKGPGGCSDISSCTSYCTKNQSDPECKKYSGQYGGFSGPGGCSDVGSCTAYCKQHSQDSECQKYSSQYGGGFSGPGGCSSESSCKAYCTANSQDEACKKMASQYGGFSGPGGCTSEDSCKSYCQANSSDAECQKYSGSFQGPGGCNSVESCKVFCQGNSSDPQCQQYAGQSGFKGPGGCNSKDSCVSYCKGNPNDPDCAPYVGQYKDQYQQQAPTQGVQGVTTSRGLLQIVIDWLGFNR